MRLKMPQAPQYDYKLLCSELLKKLLPILGPDATLQTVLSVPEIELSSNGSIRQIYGDPQLVFEKLVAEFGELSRFVINHVTHELHVEHENKSQVQGQFKVQGENV